MARVRFSDGALFAVKLFVNFQRSTSDFQFQEQQSIHDQTNLDGMWQIKGSAEVVFKGGITLRVHLTPERPRNLIFSQFECKWMRLEIS